MKSAGNIKWLGVVPALALVALLLAAAPAGASVPSRSAATTIYKHVEADEKVLAGWTGSTASCTVGTESQASIDATLDAVNGYRQFAGVKTVTLNPQFNQAALAAATAMQAAGRLDHDIGPDFPCYSQEAADGAAHSNLALGLSGAKAIEAYMGEEGDLGHRRYVLFPGQIEIGTGSTGGANAMYVIGGELDGSRVVEVPDDSKVAWPSAGWFPTPWAYETETWSVSLGSYDTQDAIDASRAKVHLKIDGKKAAVKDVTELGTEYGMGKPLTWQLKKRSLIKKGDHKIAVKITGVTLDGKPFPVSYKTKAFDPR